LFLDDLKYMIYRKSFHNGVPFHAFTQHRHNTYTLEYGSHNRLYYIYWFSPVSPTNKTDRHDKTNIVENGVKTS
jgi:hypothetical protein